MGKSVSLLSVSHRRRPHVARIIARFVRLLLVAGLAIAGWDLVPKTDRKSAQEINETGERMIGPAIRAEYPLSLIPGGLATDAELEAARAADPILADHYADVGFLRTAFLPHDKLLYASYRQGRSIVWTSSPILVRAGELVLADRSGNLVRGRCGNRLSDTPRSPAAFVQPPEAISETPEIAFVDAPSLPPSSVNDLSFVLFPPFPAIEAPETVPVGRPVPTTVTVAPGLPVGPFEFGTIPLNPIWAPVVRRPGATPEPGSGWLLIAGGILIAFGWKARR
jgi:hypothetical protein